MPAAVVYDAQKLHPELEEALLTMRPLLRRAWRLMVAINASWPSEDQVSIYTRGSGWAPMSDALIELNAFVDFALGERGEAPKGFLPNGE